AGGVRIEAGENRGARRQAKRIDAEGVMEETALFANAIDVRCVQNFIARERRLVGAEAVADKANNVRALGAWLLDLLGEGFKRLDARCARGGCACDVLQDCAAILHVTFKLRLGGGRRTEVWSISDGCSRCFLA